MKRIAMLLRKEWMESQWFVYGGLAIFVALGRILGTPDAVLLLGGAFAMLMAIATTCRDLGGGLESFWRSRPIGLVTWMTVKYAAGLVTILTITWVALGVDLLLQDANSYTLGMLVAHSFSIIVLYSIAFALSCACRRTVHAVLLSMAAGLAVYFLPVVVPALEQWSVYNLILEHRPFLIGGPGEDQLRTMIHGELNPGAHVYVSMPGSAWTLALPKVYVPFMLGMSVASAASLVLAWLALARHWQLTPGRQMTVWTLGAVGVLLVAATANQLGSNLKLKARYPLSPDRNRVVFEIVNDRDQGVLKSGTWEEGYVPAASGADFQRFDLSRSPPRLGPPIPVGASRPQYQLSPRWSHTAWSAARPERVYLLSDDVATVSTGGKTVQERQTLELLTIDLAPDAEPRVSSRLELLSHFPLFVPTNVSLPALYLHGEKIHFYVWPSGRKGPAKLATIDLKDPASPTLGSVLDIPRCTLYLPRDSDEFPRRTKFKIDLLAIPGCDPNERLEAAMLTWNWGGFAAAREGNLLVTYKFPRGTGLATWELTSLTDETAVFHQLGQRPPTPLERLAQNGELWDLFVRERLVYVLTSGGLTVFDVRDPVRPRRAGHYAAPREDFRAMSPLSDGNVLLAGRSLHVVIPPRRPGN